MRHLRVISLSLSLTIVVVLTTAASADRRAMTSGDFQSLCTGSDTTSKNACRIYIFSCNRDSHSSCQQASNTRTYDQKYG
jgi:hypothetical protein